MAGIEPEASPRFGDGGRADTEKRWWRKGGRERGRGTLVLVKPLEEGLGEVVLDGGGGGGVGVV